MVALVRQSNSGADTAVIALAASGQVVAAVAGKRIRLLQFYLVTTLANSVKWQSAATTDLTGAAPLAANGGLVCPCGPGNSPMPWAITLVGEALTLNMTVGTAVGGVAIYDTVD
jgi:hypothetical protein